MFVNVTGTTFRLIQLLSITTLACGCMSLSNRQLTSQLEAIELSVRQDERGLIITLPTVYFEFDSSNLTMTAREKIAQIALIFNREHSKERTISVEGHSDTTGDLTYNLHLSSERAEVVMKEFVFNNIDQSRLSSLGKGENSPIAGNSTEAGRRANRRVEIIVYDEI